MTSESLKEARCIAQVSEPPHYLHTHDCPNRATKDIGGHALCGVHARVARRWEKEGRLDVMVTGWWKSPDVE